MVICIDFQGGSHGNFLEFACNKFLAGVDCGDLPFSVNGASHSKPYMQSRVFFANHYFQDNIPWPANCDKMISVRITPDDLLPLSAISLLRAGNYGYDNDTLEIDTYHKFNNKHYRATLDNLISSFFSNRLKEAYDAVKDLSWPDLVNDRDFHLLPVAIKEECRTQHGIEPLYLDQDHPHCPRYILREFFKIGFRDPERSGFMSRQTEKMIYDPKYQVHNFEFDSFYDQSRFLEQMTALAGFTQLPIKDLSGLMDLHEEFLQRQPYKNLKPVTDDIYQQVIDGKSMIFQDLNLFQESYLDARFERAYGREAPTKNVKWFADAHQARQHFGI